MNRKQPGLIRSYLYCAAETIIAFSIVFGGAAAIAIAG